MIDRVRSMSSGIGIAGSLKELKGVSPADFTSLAELAMKDSCMTTNPVAPETWQVVEVYQNAFDGRI